MPLDAQKNLLDAILTCEGCQHEEHAPQAYISRPLGSGIGRPSSRAVSIHSPMISCAFVTACSYNGGGNVAGGFQGGGGRIAIIGFQNNDFAGAIGDQGTIYVPSVPSILQTEDDMIISWPRMFAGFRLESANTLALPIPWNIVTNVSAFSNNRYSITIPANTSQSFFRLIKP